MTATQSATVQLTSAEFDDVLGRAGVPVLVDFWAEWCPPCRAIAPVIDRLAEQFRGRAVVGKVDVDAESALARRFEVSSIPTLLLFKDGRVVDRVVGVVTEDELAGRIERAAS